MPPTHPPATRATRPPPTTSEQRPRVSPTSPNPPGGLVQILRRTPLWARWVLTILAFVVLIVVGRNFVHNSEGASGPTSAERKAESEANREGDIVVEEDQAPHTAPLHPGAQTRVALEAAIASDARNRIHSGELTGPFQSVRCAVSGSPHAGRQAFRCTVRSASIAYTFLAVHDEQAHQLTWCKIDPPANGATAIPVSARCRA
jgi:hypothetical protein